MPLLFALEIKDGAPGGCAFPDREAPGNCSQIPPIGNSTSPSQPQQIFHVWQLKLKGAAMRRSTAKRHDELFGNQRS